MKVSGTGGSAKNDHSAGRKTMQAARNALANQTSAIQARVAASRHAATSHEPRATSHKPQATSPSGSCASVEYRALLVQGSWDGANVSGDGLFGVHLVCPSLPGFIPMACGQIDPAIGAIVEIKQKTRMALEMMPDAKMACARHFNILCQCCDVRVDW
jgi:hypothetical protein